MIKHNMAQRTIHTRLAAANDTRQQLEDEISRLRVELDRRPPVTEAQNLAHPLPSTDTADGTLSHTSLKHILEQQQEMMAAQLTALNNLVEVSSSNRRQADFRSSGDHPTASATSRTWKLDIPTLQASEDTDLSTFADWRTRWVDYVALTRVMNDVRTTTARQGLLRSALHPKWTVLWQTGRLDIALDDDIDEIVEKLGRYLHLRRNPLLDRKDFFNRNQEDGENIDQYVSALVRIHNRCGFDDEEEDRCLQCGHS